MVGSNSNVEGNSDNDSPHAPTVSAIGSSSMGVCNNDHSINTLAKDASQSLESNSTMPLCPMGTSQPSKAPTAAPTVLISEDTLAGTSDEVPFQNDNTETDLAKISPPPPPPTASLACKSDYPPTTAIELGSLPVFQDSSQNRHTSTAPALKSYSSELTSNSPSPLRGTEVAPSGDPPASPTTVPKIAGTSHVVTSDDSQVSTIDSTNLLLSPATSLISSDDPKPAVTTTRLLDPAPSPSLPAMTLEPQTTITSSLPTMTLEPQTTVSSSLPTMTLEQHTSINPSTLAHALPSFVTSTSILPEADKAPPMEMAQLKPAPVESSLTVTTPIEVEVKSKLAPAPGEAQVEAALTQAQVEAAPAQTAPITTTNTSTIPPPLSPSTSAMKIDSMENSIKIESMKDSFKEESYKIANPEHPIKTNADFATDHDSTTTHNLHLPIQLSSNLSSTALVAELDHHLAVDDILGCHHSCASGANEHNQHHEYGSNGPIHDPNNHQNTHPSNHTYDSNHLPLPPIVNHPHHSHCRRAENGSTTDHDGSSTGQNSHRSMLDAILNNSSNSNLRSGGSLLQQARDRAESWGGMSDLSHAAAIISAGTTIGGTSTSITGGGMGMNCVASLGLGETVANGSSSPIRAMKNDAGADIGGEAGLRPASPPLVVATFEGLLSSPNTTSGCGIGESNTGFGCNGIGSNVNGVVGDDVESNASLGITALEADLVNECPPKIGLEVPVKIAVPERYNRCRSDTVADLYSLELDLEIEEDAMMAKGIAELTNATNGTTGYWRERLDSISMGSVLNRDRFDSIASLSPSRKDSFAGVVSNLTRERFESVTSLGDCSLAMSISDLADVAGALESVVAKSVIDDDGVTKSTACKMEDNGGERVGGSEDDKDNSNTAAFPPPTIQVDPDAVQAAVLAAMAATPGSVYDMLKIGTTESSPAVSSKIKSEQQQQQKQKQQHNGSATAALSMTTLPPQRIKIEPAPQMELPPPLPSCNMKLNPTLKKLGPLPPKLPTLTDTSPHTSTISTVNPNTNTTSSTSTSEKEMEAIRARARAAAGYVPPSNSKPGSTPQISNKRRLNHPHLNRNNTLNGASYSSATKRSKTSASGRNASSLSPTPSSAYSTTKSTLPTGVVHLCASNYTTPKRSNTKKAVKNKGQSALLTSGSATKSSSKGQSEQKWEEMFQCLVEYVEEQKQKEIKGMTKEEAAAHLASWEWSGNVPTMYKRNDGKALGRWINNQRSAKSKGTLKYDREVRLVSTGLKWSVLTTNAWTDMMEELRIYVREQTKNGVEWNGNVPTNYKIKNNMATDGSEIDEDKNLGRWINRQRSLYQADKLKKERQIELEKVGLKWAVLSTTSWHAMYDTLCKYAEERRAADKNSYWDGNVPASHETNDKPPKRLGRWVNRQRSAYATDKLKKEFVEKLEKIGLKWTAHDKKPLSKGIASEKNVEAANSKSVVARGVTKVAGNTNLSNGKIVKVGQKPLGKQGSEPSLFLNGQGLNPISVSKLPPKLPALPTLAHKEISSTKNGSSSAVIIGL